MDEGVGKGFWGCAALSFFLSLFFCCCPQCCGLDNRIGQHLYLSAGKSGERKRERGAHNRHPIGGCITGRLDTDQTLAIFL